MWSEVMDDDAFAAFEEAGDIFDPAVARRLHDDIYSTGGSVDPEAAYVAFRGREPEPDALLRRRGLLETPKAARRGHAPLCSLSPARCCPHSLLAPLHKPLPISPSPPAPPLV